MQNAKPSAAQKKRDLLKSAFATMYKRPLRSRYDDRVEVDASFERNERADVVDLENDLADVIDADDGLLIDDDPDELASVHGAYEDGEGHWLVCTKCSERRLVPRGQLCTFQKWEVSFLCKSVQAICLLTKRRRLA